MDQSEETSKTVYDKLCAAISAKKSKNARKRMMKLLKNGADIHSCSCHGSPINLAVKLRRQKIIDHLLKLGAHFGVLQSTGPYAGFTALHYALKNDDVELAGILLSKHNVDPIAEANDGVQPIHLAILRGNCGFVVRHLLTKGVSIDTELSYSHHKKYALQFFEWNDNFGDKMTILTYVITNANYVYFPFEISLLTQDVFSKYRPNCLISDKNNKTLLMYAIESHLDYVVSNILPHYSEEKVNKRDNSGFAAIHYVASPGKYKRYQELWVVDIFNNLIVDKLEEHGAKLNVLVNNDPKTLPVYMAAHYGLTQTCGELILRQPFFTPLIRPLFYAIYNNFINAQYSNEDDNAENLYCEVLGNVCSIRTVEIIIRNIYRRSLCKYPVHKEEIKLMEQVLEEETKINELFDLRKQTCNEVLSLLKNDKMNFGSQNMSVYDILMAPKRVYYEAAKDKNYCLTDNMSHAAVPCCQVYEYNAFGLMIQDRFNGIRKRVNLLEKLEKITCSVIESLFLSYDCILCIIEYLYNHDLENFVKAFFATNQ